MGKRKEKRSNLDSEATRTILATLLSEFRQLGLRSEELRNGYEGMSPSNLKGTCCNDQEIDEVDFDLALADLEHDGLVKTGPMELYDNPPGSFVTVIGFFSKRKYTHLSEEGYKASTKVRLARAIPQHVHISGTFHNSAVGVGSGISQSVNISAGDAELFDRLRREIETVVNQQEQRANALTLLDEMESATDKPTRMERYTQLVGVLGDHITVLSFALLPVLHYLTK